MFPKKSVAPSCSVFAVIFGPALIILLFTALASVCRNIQPSFFCRDPAATLNAHPLTGIQSNLGVLVWCATTSVCFFCYGILRCKESDKIKTAFILWSGIFTLFLTFDDLFLVHEDLLRRYLGSWIYGKILFIIYGLFTVWYVIRFRSFILRSEYILLFLAFSFFAASIVVEFICKESSSLWRIYFEDGFKLL